MNWIDIASIVFVCVTANHLGLIGEVEEITGKTFVVFNCPKCLTMWATLAYGLCGITDFYGEIPLVLAISFLASYSALWLELLEGFIDTLYMKLYDKIYQTSDDTPPADADNGHTAGSVSHLSE